MKICSGGICGNGTQGRNSAYYRVCLKRGIFNSKLLKFHILTSLDIQEVYLQALDGKRQISIIKEYWLTKIPDKSRLTGKLQRLVASKTGVKG